MKRSVCLLCTGEIGGYMGLLIGGSVLSIMEILDFFIYNGLNKLFVRRQDYRVKQQVSANGESSRDQETEKVPAEGASCGHTYAI